jgi:hypothetical protein
MARKKVTRAEKPKRKIVIFTIGMILLLYITIYNIMQYFYLDYYK